MEKSIGELKGVVTSLMTRIDRLESMEGKIARMEHHLRLSQPPRWQPYQLPSWDEPDYSSSDTALGQLNPFTLQSSPCQLFSTPHCSRSHPQPFIMGSTPPSATIPHPPSATTMPIIPHQCLPIEPDPKYQHLSSSDIQKKYLRSPEFVLEKYSHLKGRAKAGLLAVKLAKEAYFAEEVMIRCTVSGKRQLPGLPLTELNQLKQKMFEQFPEFWNNAAEYEDVWAACVTSLNQSCKHVRTVAQQKGLL